MIQFNEVSLQLGNNPIFTDVSFILHAREKVGLIGQNGAGKSTLFALLQGLMPPDSGEIQVPKNMCFAWVKQETPALEISALEYVLDGDAIYRQQQKELAVAEESEDMNALGRIHEWMAQTEFYAKPAKAAKLLSGLGFNTEEQEKSVAEFSGGWRMRLNLAQALIADSDILLLDEPTNHLDLEAVLWLEEWLKTYPGILIIISHDRDFLDAIVGVILWLDNKIIKRFSGNYSSFENQRAMHLMQQQTAFEKQQRERAHIQSYVDRFKAQASKARQAQSRMKALERMVEMAPVHQASPFHFSFPPVELASKAFLLQLIDADLGYEDKPILRGVQFAIAPGTRIGLLGPNGAGKSTLIKALSSNETLMSGMREVSPHLKLGYFSQHQLDILREEESPFWHIKQLTSNAAEPTVRKFLGQFDFCGDRIFEAIKHFSGGEKARLALALIVWQKPNLLLLDEPTNHLDIEMREALILALQEYEGAVVVISHDRHLIRAVTDELYLVYQGRVAPFAGSIDDYPTWWKDEQTKSNQPQQAAVSKTVSSNPKEKRREAALQREARQAQVKVCQKLEAELSKIHTELAKLETELSNADIYEAINKDKLARFLKEQAGLKAKVNHLEEQLLEKMMQLESFES